MSETIRPVQEVLEAEETLEGAGVRLKRAFGAGQVPLFDPFLLLDNFASSDPRDYVAGFPWHPHRGIETVTYMLDGRVEHGDSLGNKGRIDSGDVQWMSSGSGIMHQEMPKAKEGMFQGFQLWVNLPAQRKMSNPSYRGLTRKEIPVVRSDTGATVKVVAGKFDKVEGPVAGLTVDPTYLDVQLEADREFRLPTKRGYTAFAYTIDGSGRFGPGDGPATEAKRVVRFADGDTVHVRSGSDGLRMLLVTGKPLHEPVAWYGPIVMNRKEELAQAMSDLRRGCFVKAREPIEQ
jgi:quercetin 2,3-dioxygenase